MDSRQRCDFVILQFCDASRNNNNKKSHTNTPSTMSDERSATINLPLVQSSGSLNSNTMNGNGVNSQQTPQTPTTSNNNSGATASSAASSSGITIQTALPGSNSFSVGTKANQSIISDAPVTDPGGTTTKQVIQPIQHHRHTYTPNSTRFYLVRLSCCFCFVLFSFLNSNTEAFSSTKKRYRQGLCGHFAPDLFAVCAPYIHMLTFFVL